MGTVVFRLFLLALGMLLAATIGDWIGGYWGAIFSAIGFSLFVYSLHVRSGLKLIDWLDDFKPENVPMVSGWWDELAAKLFKSLKLQLRQQKALSNALGSFRTAAQALPDGVVNLDSTGSIIWCNETAQRFLGLKLSTDLGYPLANLVRAPEFSKYLQSGQWEQPLKMRSPRSNGKILSVQAVRYGDQQMLVLVRDITALERLESMRRDFIANVSHELKTPLTVLTGFLETFRDMPLSEEQKTEYLQLMHSQASRMESLVEDLLILSALESGRNKNDEQPITLRNIAQQAMKDGEQLSGGKHVIVGSFSKETLLADGSEQELQSAFTNIVTNAIRYTPEGGNITISLVKAEDDMGREVARFSVKDSGIGISPEHIPRLTERFYRVDRSRSRESGGTGLGLAIVKHVLSRHDGELLVDSTLNVGSTFTIQVPLIPKPATATSQSI